MPGSPVAGSPSSPSYRPQSCGFIKREDLGWLLFWLVLQKKFFGRGAFFTECLWATASVCSFYNLKCFIWDILQIYKLKKNILLNIICINFYIILCLLCFILELISQFV